MKQIVQSILPGGTPRGWSYWMNWLGCERAAVYRAQQLPPAGGLSGNLATDVGTVMHKLQELYYMAEDGDLLDTTAIQWVDPMGFDKTYFAKVVKEANRCFQAYRRHHSPTELGAVMAAEETYWARDFLGLGIDFTTAPDLEVLNPPIEGLAPGLYIVDHKTFGRAGPDDTDAVRSDLRFPAYILAHPKPVAGLIVNITYRAKVPTFKRVLISPPDTLTTKRVRTTLERARDAKLEWHGRPPGDVPCRTTECRSRFERFCKFYSRCTRY